MELHVQDTRCTIPPLTRNKELLNITTAFIIDAYTFVMFCINERISHMWDGTSCHCRCPFIIRAPIDLCCTLAGALCVFMSSVKTHRVHEHRYKSDLCFYSCLVQNNDSNPNIQPRWACSLHWVCVSLGDWNWGEWWSQLSSQAPSLSSELLCTEHPHSLGYEIRLAMNLT